MGKFKTFIKEEIEVASEIDNESPITIEDIRSIMDDMSDEEIDTFGAILYDEFFDSDENETSDDLSFSYEDVISMIGDLGEDMLEYVYDLLLPEEIEDITDEVDESVLGIMQTKNINRKKRKFMRKSLAQLRKEAPKRRIQNRRSYAKRRRYASANASKIARYKKSRAKLIKKGAHHVKIRKSSGLTA